MTDTIAPPVVRSAAFADLEHELNGTRRVLERAPDKHWEWTPHEKSMPLGRMCTHLVEVLRLAQSTVTSDAFDLIDEHIGEVTSRDQVLSRYDAVAGALLTSVNATSPEAWGETWKLTRGEMVIRAMPRAAALRIAGINHLLHHRGQLTVYLRLLGVPVPGLYGPSADERV